MISRSSVIIAIIAVTILASGVSGARSKLAPAKPATSPVTTARGPEVPFPLSALLPFPWGRIEGVWQAETQDGTLYFSFEKTVDTNGRKLLQVNQLDGRGTSFVASGVGVIAPSDKLVRAAMAGQGLGNYMLYIGSYRNPSQVIGARKTVTVLTIRPFGGTDPSRDRQYVVTKVAPRPLKNR